MRFGFHISIKGGFSKVVERATIKNCETIQIFSRNPRGWQYKPLVCGEVEKFKKDLKIFGISPLFIHMPYLPNLASSNPGLHTKSRETLEDELKRADLLGASFVIVHVGSRVQATEEIAQLNVIRGINAALQRVENGVGLLLENTAGQGGEIGYKFSQLKEIIRGVEDQKRIGVCLDTAHAFEAGYNLSTPQGLETSLDEFERFVGLKKIHLIHLNDSKTPLGSHSDRHWHIGEGHIGLDGFINIVNHPLLKNLPGILETPCKDDKEDLKNMGVIKGLVQN